MSGQAERKRNQEHNRSDAFCIHIVTWYLEPADHAVKESVQHVAKLLAEVRPDVVCLQNLTVDMMRILSNHDAIANAYYSIFPGLTSNDTNTDDERHVGMLVRQPYHPEKVNTFIVPKSPVHGLSCTITLGGGTTATSTSTSNRTNVQFHVATCVLHDGDDESSDEIRLRQWKQVLSMMQRHPKCILAISTFSNDRGDDNDLIVPSNRGWTDAWYNMNCPKQTEYTYDGGRNDLIPDPLHKYRYDRILYRMPARVIKNGLMGKKPSISVRYDDGTGAPNSILCPSSTHYGWGVFIEVDRKVFLESDSEWNYKPYMSMAEKNALSIEYDRTSHNQQSKQSDKTRKSSASSRSNKQRPYTAERVRASAANRGQDVEDDEADPDAADADEEVVQPLTAKPNRRSLKVPHRDGEELPEYLQGVKVDKKKHAIRSEEVSRLQSARAIDDISRTMDELPGVDPKDLKNENVIRNVVWKGQAGDTGDTRRAYKGPSVASTVDKIGKDRESLSQRQREEAKMLLKDRKIDPKKMSLKQVQETVFGTSIKKENVGEKVPENIYKDLEAQRSADTNAFKEHQRSGNY